MAKRNANGYYFLFEDGHSGWVLGWSAAEKRAEVRKHGRLIRWIPA